MPILQVAIGALMISLAGVFVKIVTVDPTAAAFYRMLFGGLALAAITRLRGESLWFGWKTMWPAVLAAFWFALDLLFWHRSIRFVGPGLATLLANFQVFLLALAGVWLFKEKLGWRMLVSIPLAFVGLALLVLPEWNSLGEQYQWGVILGLITAVCYAAYTLTLRASRTQANVTASNYANMAVLSLSCALMLVPMTLGMGESLALTRWEDAAWLLLYGLAAQIFGWQLISRGLPKLDASTIGLVLLLQPVGAFVWDFLWFERQLMVGQFVGAGLALAAIYLGSLRSR
ncbi:MAG: DMT family transporter [Gammaproteobacteria bacterium]|nr:DMT family transporter [Gammaproteobacteria bacterium]